MANNKTLRWILDCRSGRRSPTPSAAGALLGTSGLGFWEVIP